MCSAHSLARITALPAAEFLSFHQFIRQSWVATEEKGDIYLTLNSYNLFTESSHE